MSEPDSEPGSEFESGSEPVFVSGSETEFPSDSEPVPDSGFESDSVSAPEPVFRLQSEWLSGSATYSESVSVYRSGPSDLHLSTVQLLLKKLSFSFSLFFGYKYLTPTNLNP